MDYDIIFVVGEMYIDHPLCGMAILKHVLEDKGFKVGIIEMPTKEQDILKLGKPNLFFGVSSGSIDSMVRNYTPLKKLRKDDKNLEYNETVPDRAVIVFSNWIRKHFKGTPIVIGGVEATLRRFTHYDYWDNDLRKSIMFDSRADIMVYGSAEKQLIEIANRLKEGKTLEGIEGTCIVSRELPKDFIELPSHEEASSSKMKFCEMQTMFTNWKNIAQRLEKRYVLQYKSPLYTPQDLDYYYSFPFSRKVPKEMRGFQFSVVIHRGCIGNCNFCSLTLSQGDRIVSRSEASILAEIKRLTKFAHFKGKVDDLTGPSVNMYGMDCDGCDSDKVGFVSLLGWKMRDNEKALHKHDCLSCKRLDRSNRRFISLLKQARNIPGIWKVNIRSGIRYDLASSELIKEIAQHHIFETLRLAPEHYDKNVLRLMNKDYGNLDRFIHEFKKYAPDTKLSFYFMTAHPGSTMKEAELLGQKISKFKNAENVQVFTPTPMSCSTCMYYTAMDPFSKKSVYVPYTYAEKKQQKRVVMNDMSFE